jgi:nucleoside phosphorylase
MKDSRHKQTDLVILTALRDPELDAVLNLPYNWSPKYFSDDPLAYHFGELPRSDRSISVVCACANRKGMPSSAAVASKLVHMFHPKYLVMLGICAGISNKTNLGDVIVADPTWDCGSGKQGIDSKGSSVFQATPHQVPLNMRISQIVAELADDESILKTIKRGWTSKVPEGVFKIHTGPMASGSSVIANKSFAEAIVEQDIELIAIEMEAFAVMAAAEYSADPNLIAMVIKSVCDYADAEKSDDWQRYAAYTSAAFADQLFRRSEISFVR